MAKRKKPARKGVAGIDEQLRQAILDSGQSLYAVAKGAGVDPSAVIRYVHRERDFRLETAALVARHLGLELAPIAGRKGAKL